MTTSTLLEAALEYAAMGWHVIPLHTPRPANRCSCNDRTCTNQGKHPRTRNGLKDATTDAATIESWWGMWPDANVGIVCGPSGLVAIDVDPRHGGDEDWRDIKEKYGKDIQQTVSAHTGGGGEHYIYLAPGQMPISNVSNSDKYTGPLGRGIDVRSAGGYIVAPPSLHASGNYYEWYEGEAPGERSPQRLPLALAELLSQPARDNEYREPVSVSKILEGVEEGGRDWTLFQMASKLRYADVPIDWAYRLVEDAAAACTPPFPRIQARKKVESAYNRYSAGSGAFVTTEEAASALQHVYGLTGREFIGPVIDKGPQPTQWIIQDLVVAGRIHMLYGEPESGKTIIALSWMLQVIENGGDVLFVDEESGIEAIAGLLRDMGADSATVDAHVHYFPFLGLEPEHYGALLDYADNLQPTLVCFDSLTDMLASAGLDENSGVQVTKWMLDVPQALARREYAPGVTMVDHVPKDTENIRYSVASRAKKAKSDVLWYVRKMADFDRETTAKVELERHKNRPGVLPKKVTYTIGGEAGKLICRPFDVSQDAIELVPTGAQDMLLLIQSEGPKARHELSVSLGKSVETIRSYAEVLIRQGRLERVGYGRGQTYRAIDNLVDSNRQPVDSQSTDLSTDFGGSYNPRSVDKPLGRKTRKWYEDKEDDPWE